MRPLLLFIALVGLTGRAGAEPAFVAEELGAPLTLLELGKPGALAAQWIDAAYGLDATRVPIYVLSGDEFAVRYRALGGAATPMNVSVDGFAFRGTVFMKRGGLFGLSAKTLTHELLHVLSSRFSADAKGRRNLVEGLTEFFTARAAPPERAPPGARLRRSAYGGYVQFARALAALVGEEALARCFFKDGYGALERLVDRRAGKGTLRRATRYLEANAIQAALNTLHP